MGFEVVVVHRHQFCRTRSCWFVLAEKATRDAFEEELVGWLKTQL